MAAPPEDGPLLINLGPGTQESFKHKSTCKAQIKPQGSHSGGSRVPPIAYHSSTVAVASCPCPQAGHPNTSLKAFSSSGRCTSLISSPSDFLGKVEASLSR